MYLKEARIIAVVRNPEDLLQLNSLQNRILEAFGGFTRTQSYGAWRNPETGEIVYDESYCLDIAVQDTLETRLKLQELAQTWGKATDQVSVYVRYPNGSVDFIETSRDTEAVA